MRTPSMKLAEEVPFQLDEDAAHSESPDGKLLSWPVSQLMKVCCTLLLGSQTELSVGALLLHKLQHFDNLHKGQPA